MKTYHGVIPYQEIRKRLTRFKQLNYTTINCKSLAGILDQEYYYIVNNFLNGDHEKVITNSDLKSLLEKLGYKVYSGDIKGRGFYLNGSYNKRIRDGNTYHSFRECLELVKDYL